MIARRVLAATKLDSEREDVRREAQSARGPATYDVPLSSNSEKSFPSLSVLVRSFFVPFLLWRASGNKNGTKKERTRS